MNFDNRGRERYHPQKTTYPSSDLLRESKYYKNQSVFRILGERIESLPKEFVGWGQIESEFFPPNTINPWEF